MKKVFQGIGAGFVALALSLSVGASSAYAALTLGATSVTTDGAFTVTSVAATDVTMFAANTTGTITVGGTAQTGAIAIGDTAASTVAEISIGGGNGPKTAINIGDGTGANGINIGTGDTGVKTIGIGSGAAANVVTIGSATAAASLALLAGTGDVSLTSVDDITINGGSTGSIINLGTSAFAHVINIGVNAVGNTVNIGTGATVANTINIGTGAVANVIHVGSASSGLTYHEETEATVGTDTLTIAESGKTFYLATTPVLTLPAVATANGVVYRFVVAADVTSNATITSAAGDDIEGALIVAGAVVDCDASDVITFVADGENLGDFVEIRSNGTKWFITQSNALTTAKLTCTG